MAEDSNKAAPESEQDSALPNPTFPPIGEVEQPPPEKEPQGSDTDAGYQQMEERLRAIEARAEEERRQASEREMRYQQTINRLIESQQTQAAPRKDPYDLSDLPDPVDNPKEYHSALAERLKMIHEQGRESAQAAQASPRTRQEALDAMWGRFQQEHAELASKPILVKGATIELANELRSRGLDFDQYVQTQPDAFMRELAERIQAEVGTPAGAGSGEAPADAGSGGRQGGGNRTGGVAQGSSAPGAKSRAQPKPSSFMDELKETQAKLGLI